MDREAKRPEDQTKDEPTRRAYRKPVLTEYGSISKLTRGGGSTRVEPGSPIKRMGPCL
jgi:hypothetical protein